MNKYVAPELELVKLVAQSIIMTSVGGDVEEDETIPVPGKSIQTIDPQSLV